MIALFTDFGLRGPYVGQLQAALARHLGGEASAHVVVSLMHDAPAFRPRPAAYLLAALVADFPPGTVFVCVVDPGVGGARKALILEADGRVFTGPDNGLLAVVAHHAGDARWYEITWKPQRLSASFHARDLFAPVAAMLASGREPSRRPFSSPVGEDWPHDLFEIIYVDRFGNAMTGIRAAGMDLSDGLQVGGCRVRHARTFSEVGVGEAFWYVNAVGLVEIAVNQGDAAGMLGLEVGDPCPVCRGS